MKEKTPEQQFEPDQASLRREPRRCPHCGEALPAEPEVMEPDRRVRDPSGPDARYAGESQRVEIFGGDSGFTEEQPFTIGADRVTTVEDLALWMARIAGKKWSREEEFFRRLGGALQAALEAEGSTRDETVTTDAG